MADQAQEIPQVGIPIPPLAPVMRHGLPGNQVLPVFVVPQRPVPMAPLPPPARIDVPPAPVMPGPLAPNATLAQTNAYQRDMITYAAQLNARTTALQMNAQIDLALWENAHQAALRATSGSGDAPKLSFPEKFSGKDKKMALAFLNMMKTIFSQYPQRYHSEQAMITAISSRLTDDALIWHNSVLPRFVGPNADYQRYRAEFITTQGVVNARIEAEIQLAKPSMQQGRGSISNVITRVRSYGADTAWWQNEEIRIEKLYDLMNPDLQKAMDHTPLTNPDGSRP